MIKIHIRIIKLLYESDKRNIMNLYKLCNKHYGQTKIEKKKTDELIFLLKKKPKNKTNKP